MNNNLTSAQCRLCGRVLRKRQMPNHLKSCWRQHEAAASEKKAQRWFHLVIEGRYAPDYWLHLQAPGNCTFGDLDQMLRRLWLECCGHLSAFEFPVKRKAGGPRGRSMAALFDLIDRTDAAGSFDTDEDQVMGERLDRRLQTGTVFTYQYDFGSTTHLALRVAGQYTQPAVKGDLKLLARNEPPEILCSVCGKPATQLCSGCPDWDQRVFCDACAAQHECGEDMLLPLINSPRAGVCGYCGPSVEP